MAGFKRIAMALAFVGCVVAFAAQAASALVELDVGYDGLGEALFEATDGPHGAVLIHQSHATKESWKSFATALAARGIASLAPDHSHPFVLKAAVRFLKDRGYRTVTLIGARAGGRAIMQVLAADAGLGVDKVVLLTPTDGPALSRPAMGKLMIGVKMDFLGNGARKAYLQAAEPKRHIEYDSRDLGQNLLTGAYGPQATRSIIEFILEADE